MEKTWTGRYHSNSEILLHKITGESSNNVELAKISPEIVFECEKPRLIDEWHDSNNCIETVKI